MVHYCRNRREEGLVKMLSNKFEVLKSRVIQRGKEGGREVEKDRKEILREERAKRGKTKIERKEKKEKVLREDNKEKEKLKEEEAKKEEVEEEEKKKKLGKEAQWQTLPWPQARKRRQKASQQKEEKVRKNIGKNGRCYKYGGLGYMKRDHEETERQIKPRWQKKESEGKKQEVKESGRDKSKGDKERDRAYKVGR